MMIQMNSVNTNVDTKRKSSLTKAVIGIVASTVFRQVLKQATLETQPVLSDDAASAGKVEYCKLPGPPPRRRRHPDWE
jgi:hypothetical protein